MDPAVNYLISKWREKNLKTSIEAAAVLSNFEKIESPTELDKDDRKAALRVLSRTVLIDEFTKLSGVTLAKYLQMTVDYDVKGVGETAAIALNSLSSVYPGQEFLIGGYSTLADAYVMGRLIQEDTPIFHGSGKKVTDNQLQQLAGITGLDFMALVPNEFTPILVPVSAFSAGPCLVVFCPLPQLKYSNATVDLTAVSVLVKAKDGVRLSSYAYVADDSKPFNMKELDPDDTFSGDSYLLMGQKRMFTLVAYALRTLKEMYQ